MVELLDILRKYQKKAAEDSLKQAMSACMASATDAAARASCKDNTAKNALATSLGKDPADVTKSELQNFVDKAARDSVGPRR